MFFLRWSSTNEYDSKLSIYLSGDFEASANFDYRIIHSEGSRDQFIAKADSGGNVLWAKNAGGIGNDFCWDLLVENDNVILTTGDFSDSANFGNGVYLKSGLESNVSLASYDSLGNCRWARNFESSGAGRGHHIGNDRFGNLYLCGFVTGDSDFGEGWKGKGRGGHDGFIVKFKMCEGESFDFPENTTLEKFTYIGEAEPDAPSRIRVTPSENWIAGASWYVEPLEIRNGFIADFAFRFYGGDDGQYPEGSAPGADGIAFVLQGAGNNVLGAKGYGIGYKGIPNSLAIEFDTYLNDENALNNMHDPNGNHVAVFCNGRDPILCDHASNTCLATNENIPLIKPDSSVYYGKVVYNAEVKLLRVYFDSVRAFENPVIEIRNLDIASRLDLIDGGKVFMGFTSSTGVSKEVHEVTEFSVCVSEYEDILPVEEPEYMQKTKAQTSPNPFGESTSIQFELKEASKVELQIYDLMGRRVDMIDVGWRPSGVNKVFWDAKGRRSGIYHFVIRTGIEFITGSMVLSR